MPAGTSLRTRLFTCLAALVLVTLLGGVVLCWYTYRIEGLMASITAEHLGAYENAENMEKALVRQKGFVSYFFIDRDPAWLAALAEERRIFDARLADARRLAGAFGRVPEIDAIGAAYRRYVGQKDRVVELYRAGRDAEGRHLHAETRRLFESALQLCAAYKQRQIDHIYRTGERSHAEARQLRLLAVTAMAVAFLLATLLASILLRQVLDPLRRIAAEAARREQLAAAKNEVQVLTHSVRGLIADVDKTEDALRRSRQSLAQAEKMALVGKLAAGVAHSIRNPFTSIKMRLFSLDRSLHLTEAQREDFEVISKAIRHVDNILQNFLEFSRPPKLRMETVSPSTVIDQTLQLLGHRLKAYGVRASVNRTERLPPVSADPEQLKEAFANLMINACEAMELGGRIQIDEHLVGGRDGRRWIEIRIADSGPGIPPEIQASVGQPFFTTKEHGTGLGLSIAKRIVAEHLGELTFESPPGRGATFTVTLPLKEVADERHPGDR